MTLAKVFYFLLLHASSSHLFAKKLIVHNDVILKIFYIVENKTRMLEVILSKNNHEIVDCYSYGDAIVIEGLLAKISGSQVHYIKKEEISTYMEICSIAKVSGALPDKTYFEKAQNLGLLSGVFIYPGTKWCGAGDIAKDDDDLGQHVETDKCCREHDHCEDSIPGFGTKHGLKNISPVTKSNCSCDEKFYNCLQTANTKTSNNLGSIYFNLLQMECFKLDHPIVRCLEYKGATIFHQSCQEYELNEEEDPVWQFFDAKWFEPPEDDGAISNQTPGFFYPDQISACEKYFSGYEMLLR